MASFKKRGIILFVVLGIILIVGLLAVAILRIISSQSRLTHHQVTRIQAQYAAKAGIMYALDKLRLNDDAACWSASGSYTRYLCRSDTGTPPCTGACLVVEPWLPPTVNSVAINVSEPGTGLLGTRPVRATADFTYTPD